MIRFIKIFLFLGVLLIAFISLRQIAMGCQVDEFYMTKAGYLDSPSMERLQKATNYEKEDKSVELNDLIKNKLVVRLKDNVRVRALERSFEMKMIKIGFEDGKDFLWVNAGSLKQIQCDDK